MTDRDIVDDMALRVIAFATGLPRPIWLKVVPEITDDGECAILVSPRVARRIAELQAQARGDA